MVVRSEISDEVLIQTGQGPDRITVHVLPFQIGEAKTQQKMQEKMKKAAERRAATNKT